MRERGREGERRQERGREGERERERGKLAAPAPADVQAFAFNQLLRPKMAGLLLLIWYYSGYFFPPDVMPQIQTRATTSTR